MLDSWRCRARVGSGMPVGANVGPVSRDFSLRERLERASTSRQVRLWGAHLCEGVDDAAGLRQPLSAKGLADRRPACCSDPFGAPCARVGSPLDRPETADTRASSGLPADGGVKRRGELFRWPHRVARASVPARAMREQALLANLMARQVVFLEPCQRAVCVCVYTWGMFFLQEARSHCHRRPSVGRGRRWPPARSVGAGLALRPLPVWSSWRPGPRRQGRRCSSSASCGTRRAWQWFNVHTRPSAGEHHAFAVARAPA